MKANSRAPRIFFRVVKFTFTCFVFLVCGIVLWRVFTSGDPAAIKTVAVNSALAEAYEQHGEELTLQYQPLQTTITRGEHNSGYFGVTQTLFIPQASQVQIVFRYNNSTLRHLQEDYGLASLPDKALCHFDVTLVKTTDLTPEIEEDYKDTSTFTTERYYPSEHVIRETTALYTYYRYTFEGVTVEEDTLGVFVDIYYNQDVCYEEEAYGRLCIYNAYYADWKTYKWSRADKRALEAFLAGEQE